MNHAFNLTLIGYFTALLLAAANLFTREQRRFATAATWVLTAGAIAQTTYLVLRWVAAGRAPFSNMFESLVLFVWAVVVIYLALQMRHKIPVLGATTALLAVLTLAYASTFEMKIDPLMPALRSNWLTVHVFTCFLGYGGVALAFLSSLVYLIVTRNGSTARPQIAQALELVTEKTISFGFLFITVGIISGAVWANSAWGTYWSWDPKETWSLITWFIYAVFLHCRFMRGWRGKRAAWISVIGFASIVFTYFGVNYLLSGLHSYAN
ncbi:MAG: c-type cytochrome biogenesis protein CcsB [Verrucomicrobia bacterium]|nr:c-type cytochrome biogenesis protein CcsB [Verrucomicrobiota bacterium]